MTATPLTDALDLDPAPYKSLNAYLLAVIEQHKDHARSLEQRLAYAVELLEKLLDDDDLSTRTAARAALPSLRMEKP